MEIWDENKLIIFIAFVIPGFVSLKIYELLFPSEHHESSKQIVDAIAYSCLNYAILLWPITRVETTNLNTTHPNIYAVFYLVVLFVFPVLWVFIWKWIRESDKFQNFAPHPTQKPWDFVFGNRRTYWIVVNLKSGKRIGGMYGLNSFASSAPANEQIYLEQEWLLNDDGGFERPAEQSAGIIILTSEVETVELYNSGEPSNDKQEK
jgi:hypothetical protein